MRTVFVYILIWIGRSIGSVLRGKKVVVEVKGKKWGPADAIMLIMSGKNVKFSEL